MHPLITILEIGGHERPIGTFGVLLALAILVGGVVGVRGAARAGLEPGSALAAAGFVTAGSLVGAWSLQILVETLRSGSLAHAVSQGGIVFYGAPLGGGLALALVARPLGLPLGRLVDVAIPAIPMAHGLGRIGCFFAGCCYGAPCDLPFAVTYTDALAPGAYPPVPRHPVPLYEAFVLFAIAAVLLLRPPAHVGSGRRAVGYVVAYGMTRLVMERFRGDAERGVLPMGLSTSDLISLVAVIVGAVVLVRMREPDGPRRGAPEVAR